MRSKSDEPQIFDYVVVGAGSAGCVVASRLSEDCKRTVLVLEAGSSGRNPLYGMPMLAGALNRMSMNNWSYETVPQAHLNNRIIGLPRGKLVGGSFMFNGAKYIRGHPADYDHWRQLGNVGWAYDDVLPYFKRSEKYEGVADKYHSDAGGLTVSLDGEINPLSEVFIEAAVQAGHRRNPDFNGIEQQGFGRYHHNIRRGRRHTTADAFLRPALSRRNIELRTQALVRRLIVKDGRAIGVSFDHHGQQVTVHARCEVVLTAGSINTPQLLLLSGIGPARELHEHEVEVVLDLPGVGKNLQDHLLATVGFRCLKPMSLVQTLRIDRFAIATLRFLLSGTGPISMSPLQSGGFFRSKGGLAAPDLQVAFYPILGSGPGTSEPRLMMPWAQQVDTFAAVVWKSRPDSVGEVTLSTPEATSKPLINPKFLSWPSDLDATRAGVRELRRIFSQSVFDGIRGEELLPGPEFESDSQLDEAIKSQAASGYHTCGTAKMGNDRMAVVDSELRLRGINGLRIADASIMPTVPSGNTNAPTIMIAEKASDLIKAAHGYNHIPAQ